MAGTFTREGAGRIIRATQLVEQAYGVQPTGWYRRRFPRGGGGGSPPTRGLLILDIPARSNVLDAIELETYTPGIGWEPVLVNPDAAPEDADYGETVKIGGCNRSFQAMRGSVDTPVAVTGVEFVEDTEGERYLVIDNLLDLAILPGHETTTLGGERQGPSHPSGNRQYDLDGSLCSLEEEPE